eukprot:1147041-Pelagomonas_calceolata.AAC.5
MYGIGQPDSYTASDREQAVAVLGANLPQRSEIGFASQVCPHSSARTCNFLKQAAFEDSCLPARVHLCISDWSRISRSLGLLEDLTQQAIRPQGQSYHNLNLQCICYSLDLLSSARVRQSITGSNALLFQGSEQLHRSAAVHHQQQAPFTGGIC